MAVLSSTLLARITSEHNQKPNYMATVEITVDPYVDGDNLALSLETLFDLDTSVGEQLDFVGQWVGLTRYISSQLNVFFSFDTPLLGFDQGRWRTPYDAGKTSTARLDDDAYRTLLRARVASNYWDGTIEGSYKAWDILFAGTGYQVIIQDGAQRGNSTTAGSSDIGGPAGLTNGNMHITQAILGPPLDVLTTALFTGGYLTLKSAAVGVKLMKQGDGYNDRPLFAFDAGPTPVVTPMGTNQFPYPPYALAGFDIGAWGVVLNPVTAAPATVESETNG
jgi:hypothetical protein